MAVKEESNVITDLYTANKLYYETRLENAFILKHPIEVYILYSFLIQLPEINPEDVIKLIKDNDGYYTENYSQYYTKIVDKLIPDTYYEKYFPKKVTEAKTGKDEDEVE